MTCKYAQCGETIYTAEAVNGSRCALFVEAFAGVIILAWRICRAVGIAQAIELQKSFARRQKQTYIDGYP